MLEIQPVEPLLPRHLPLPIIQKQKRHQQQQRQQKQRRQHHSQRHQSNLLSANCSSSSGLSSLLPTISSGVELQQPTAAETASVNYWHSSAAALLQVASGADDLVAAESRTDDSGSSARLAEVVDEGAICFL